MLNLILILLELLVLILVFGIVFFDRLIIMVVVFELLIMV